MNVTVAPNRATTMAKAPVTIRAIDCGGSLHTVGTGNERVTAFEANLLQNKIDLIFVLYFV